MSEEQSNELTEAQKVVEAGLAANIQEAEEMLEKNPDLLDEDAPGDIVDEEDEDEDVEGDDEDVEEGEAGA